MGKEIREVTSPKLKAASERFNSALGRSSGGFKMNKLTMYLIRYWIGKLYKSVPVEDGIRFSKVRLRNTAAVLAEPVSGTLSDDIIVYIHGGAFMSGRAGYSKGYISSLAKTSGLRTYAIDYHLSPEVKYPTAFNECLDAIDTLIEDNKDSHITITGDSAGGNLCAAIALERKDKISCVILHSPVIDLSDTIDRTGFNKDSIVVKKGLKDTFKKLYIGDHDEKDPSVSPYFGDYTKFPPVFITCDSNEGLYADSLYVFDRCSEAGVLCELVAMKGAFHAFATMGGSSPETRKLMEDYIAFMRSVVSGENI